MTATGTSRAPTVDIPWRSPALVAILAATLMTPMDVPLVSPALTEAQSALGVSESRAGLLITAYALPGILVGPLIGAFADRFGRRSVLSGCLVLFGASGTAVALTTDFTLVLGLRILQGFAAGSILSALAMTAVGDRYTGRQHDAVMGVTSAMLSLGTAVYPVIGGVLAGQAWNTPFFLYALALPVAGLVFFTFEDPGSASDTTTANYIRTVVETVPARRALGLYSIMFVSFALLFGGLYTALPFYLASTFGLGSATVGLVTSSVLVVTGLISTQNGRLSARFATGTLLVAGFGLYAIGFLGVALAGSMPLLVAALGVFGAGSGLVTPTLFASISALAPDEVRGGVMGLQTTTIGASQTVGPVLFTLLGGAVGYQVTMLSASAGAAVCTASLALSWVTL